MKNNPFYQRMPGPQRPLEVFTTTNSEAEIVYNLKTGETQIRKTGRDAYPFFSAQAIYEISIFLQGLRVHIHTVLTNEGAHPAKTEETTVEMTTTPDEGEL